MEHMHLHEDDWERLWQMLGLVVWKMETDIMAALDELTGAINNLNAVVAQAVDKITGANQDPAIAAAAQQVQAAVDQLNAAVSPPAA